MYILATVLSDGCAKLGLCRNYVNIIIKSSEKDGILLDRYPIRETFSSLSQVAGDNITQNCWVSDLNPVNCTFRSVALHHAYEN